MTLTFLAKGAIIGFSLAAPVGPIGLLCIRRSLAEGRIVRLFTGLGAATADATYRCRQPPSTPACFSDPPCGGCC